MRHPIGRRSVTWQCGVQDNNLSLNVSKTKEPIVDDRKQKAEHIPIHIDRPVVERVKSFKLLGVHITKELA
jgi:hypothetical protein